MSSRSNDAVMEPPLVEDRAGSGSAVNAERVAFQDAVLEAKQSNQVEAVISVMEKYEDSAYIQKSGCEALQGQFLQVRESPIFSSSPLFDRYFCVCLRRLCCAWSSLQDLAKVQMEIDRFVKIPLRAITKHLQVRDEDGWYIACCFLRSLAHQSDENKVALCNNGAVQALQRSMRVFRASARVQTVAISCLHVLAFVEVNRQQIGQRECIRIVVDSLRQHLDDAVLALCGCRLLQMIALNDAFKILLLEEGSVDVVFRCMSRHPTPEISSQCCGFFYFLADQVRCRTTRAAFCSSVSRVCSMLTYSSLVRAYRDLRYRFYQGTARPN